MTPKEKAKELVYKFKYVKPTKMSDYSIIYLPTAKQCALIAVDEIIDQNNLWINQTGKGTNNYWQEVKQIIEEEL
jgi:hypothetical protein